MLMEGRSNFKHQRLHPDYSRNVWNVNASHRKHQTFFFVSAVACLFSLSFFSILILYLPYLRYPVTMKRHLSDSDAEQDYDSAECSRYENSDTL